MDFLERQFELAGKIGFQAATICGFEKVVEPKKKKKRYFAQQKLTNCWAGKISSGNGTIWGLKKVVKPKKKRYFAQKKRTIVWLNKILVTPGYKALCISSCILFFCAKTSPVSNYFQFNIHRFLSFFVHLSGVGFSLGSKVYCPNAPLGPI